MKEQEGNQAQFEASGFCTGTPLGLDLRTVASNGVRAGFTPRLVNLYRRLLTLIERII